MSMTWGGKYKFERGDVVEVIGDHPLASARGVVQAVISTEQFEVIMALPTMPLMPISMTLWADDLKLISTHRPIEIPKAFNAAFEEGK